MFKNGSSKPAPKFDKNNQYIPIAILRTNIYIHNLETKD